MRVAFFGTPEFGRTILAALLDAGIEVALVVSQPDRPKQRRGRGPLAPSPVKQLATAHGIPVCTPERAADAEAELKQSGATIALVAAYGQILPDSLLHLKGVRWLNVHASLLPEYRGASPVSQAILDGRTETGVTIMEVVPALDAGPVVAQTRIPIAPNDTTGTLSKKAARAGGALLVNTVPEYAAGTLQPQPQDDTKVTVTRTLQKSDGRIDWTTDAAYLARFVRAMDPWPGAWTHFGEASIVITAAHPIDGSGTPGQFDAEPPLRVGTGSGQLVIDRLLPAGRREMDGAAWLRGVRQAGNFDS